MLKLKSVWHGAVFFGAILLIAFSIALELDNGQTTRAQTANSGSGSCGSDAFIVHPPNDPDLVLTDIVPVDVYVKPIINGVAISIDQVRVFANGQFVGSASKVSSTSNEWHIDWDTATPTAIVSGQIEMHAKLSKLGTSVCQTNTVSFKVQNNSGGTTAPSSGELILKREKPTTPQWVGTTQFSHDFVVRAEFKPDGAASYSNVTSDTYFTWKLLAGSVGKLDGDIHQKSVRYFTGGTPGTAKLVVDANYNGQTVRRTYEIIVESQADSTYPGVDEQTANEIIEDAEAEQERESVPEAEQINSADLNEVLSSDGKLTDCLVAIVGEDAYEDIVDGKRRLSFTELSKAERCFTSTRFLLPANVAPIDPQKIREVREDTRRAKVSMVQQASEVGLDREGIVFSGVSEPNRSIVLYIFSEPLVLTTTTDGDGNWTYVLEDPLAPGDHEVYVAVEGDDGEVTRSTAYNFSVAQTASVDTNPGGLSLTLDLSDPGQSSMIYYISAVVATLLIALGTYAFVIRRKGDFMGAEDLKKNEK